MKVKKIEVISVKHTHTPNKTKTTQYFSPESKSQTVF